MTYIDILYQGIVTIQTQDGDGPKCFDSGLYSVYNIHSGQFSMAPLEQSEDTTDKRELCLCDWRWDFYGCNDVVYC